MTKGVSEVTFLGGRLDGVVTDIIFPPERLSDAGDFYFAEMQDGSGALMKGDWRKDKNWHSYSIQIYEKNKKKNPRELGTSYTYVEDKVVDRCSAITLKGNRCMKPAFEDDYCKTHKPKK